jgi:hypothetical protein
MGQIYNSDSIAMGSSGEVTAFVAGEVESLPPGSEPTVSFDEGTDGVQIVNFGIPEGKPGTDGDPGPANTLTVGEVTTLPAGELASAEITGEAPEQVLNLGIPQGNDGAVGFPLAGGPGSTALMQVINGDSTSAPGGGVAGSRLAYAGLLPDGTLMVASNTASGTWAIWGVLASKEQSATTVTLMARTDGTTQLTPTAMLESAGLAANVRNCRYSYPAGKADVDCEILVNDRWHPFTATASDRTSWGPIIYRNAKAGMYGEIKPYQETE